MQRNGFQTFSEPPLIFPFNLTSHLTVHYCTLLYCTGGRAGRVRLASILRYDQGAESWEEAGEMEAARHYHQVAPLEDVSLLCP